MERKFTDMTHIQVKLERELRKKFKVKCSQNDIQYSQWIRLKIKEYVDEN